MDMPTTNTRWIIISPSVYVDIINERKVMLYDTQAQTYMISESQKMVGLVQRLYEPANMGALPYSEDAISNDADITQAFNRGIFFLKDISDGGRPINLLPYINLQTDLDCTNDEKEERLRTMGNKMRFLSGVHIYLNCKLRDSQQHTMVAFRNRSHRQHPVPPYYLTNVRLSQQALAITLNQLKVSSTAVVNIIVSLDKNEQAYFSDVLDTLSLYNFKYVFNCYDEDIKCLSELLLAKGFTGDYSITSYIDRYSRTDNLNAICASLQDQGLPVVFKKIVADESDFVDETDGIDMLPVWTGNNEAFLRRYVLMTQEDIDNSRLTMEDLFRHMKLNASSFGVMEILPTGSIYALNAKVPLGNIYIDDLYHIVEKELRENTSWRITRKETDCDECAYRTICPPVSAFETLYKTAPKCLIKR